VLRFGHYVTYLIPIALAILIYELIKISSNKYYYQINQNDNDKNFDLDALKNMFGMH
jgi:hypothetical protein